jgi:hypothetical protein
MAVMPTGALPALPAPAVGLGEFLVDLAVGAVLFGVVVTVTVVVMVIIQAVLPHGDSEADALASAQHDEDGTG